jgi:hypothetical protein
MKTVNIYGGKKQVGYLIRRDDKDSWIQAQIQKLQTQHPNATYIKGAPSYLFPSMAPSVNPPDSIRMGWVNMSDAIQALHEHLDNAKKYGYNPEEQFDFRVVKITIIEEEA